MQCLYGQRLYNDDYPVDVIGHYNEFVDFYVVMVLRNF